MAELGANPSTYGPKWVRCTRCGVNRPADALEAGKCTDTEVCIKMQVHLRELEKQK